MKIGPIACRSLLALAFGLVLHVNTAFSQARESEVRIVFPSLWNEALDPLLSAGIGAVGLAAIYDSIVGTDASGTQLSKATGVVSDWEMSLDGKIWTLNVRPGIQFHRGFGELTAEDVKFSLDRLSSARSMVQMKAYFQKKIGKVEVIGNYTVRVTAAADPIPDFLSIVSPLQASPERFVVSKKAIETLGEEGFARNPVGSGPYEFVRHIGGQSIDLKAVTSHWRIGKPRFATLRYLAVPEEETAIAMLQQGEVDLVPIMRSNIKRLQQAKISVIVQENAFATNLFMDDQFVERVPTHNPKVREALNVAIDRKLIADTLFDARGRPIGTYWSHTPVLEGLSYNWKEDLYPYDPALAKKLIAEAGYPNGFDIDVYVYAMPGMPESADTLQAVARMWEAVGIRPRLIPTEYGVVRAKLLKGEMPGAIGYFPFPVRQWEGVLASYRNFMHSTGAFNHVKDAELDKILDDGAKAIETGIATGKLKEAMKYVRKNHMAIPLIEFDSAYGASPRARHWKPGLLPNFDTLFAPDIAGGKQ